MFGEDRGEVRVVVLDADGREVQVERERGREVVGMEVVGDDLGRDREQALEVGDPVGEGAQRLVVLQVADVM